MRTLPALPILGIALLAAGSRADDDARVTACEHFAFLRPSFSEGLGGPALEALKSWDGEMDGTFGPDGSYYHLDVNNSIVFRLKDGQARVLAGDGVRGHRDGPADQARFDFGVGSYSDADIRSDAAGNLYVSEAHVGRLRRISRRPDGTWEVATLAGGGSRAPKKGEWIPARDLKHGCASRLAVTPDGEVYTATHGGILRIREGQATLVADTADLKAALGEKTALVDWHVGGSHLTPAGEFYWMPGGGPDILRADTRSGKIARVAGIGKIAQGLDGPTLLESGFHTVLAVYSADASEIFTCGGDESVPRRVAGGRVKTLHRDGTFRPYEKGGRDERWRQMAAVQCLDKEGRLYLCTGDYGWGGWIVRFTLERGKQ